MAKKAAIEASIEKQLLDILIKGIEIEWKSHVRCVLSGSDYSINQCTTCARLREALPLLKTLYPTLASELLSYRI